MTASITDQNSFVTAVAAAGDQLFLTMVIDEFAAKRMPHGILMQYQGGSFRRVSPAKWNIVSLAVLHTPAPTLIALGETGEVLVADAQGLRQENLGAEAAAGRLVPLRCVRSFGEHAYAVGMRRQAYRRDPGGQWQPIHGNMLEASNPDAVHGFEAVIALSEHELYAAGWEGEIWRYDGQHWHQAPSPTNLIITSLAATPEGQVVACGQAGLLMMGRGDDWQVLDAGTSEDLWSVVCFEGRIFVAGFRAVYELVDGQLQPVDAALQLTQSYYTLTHADQRLWSVGPKSVLVSDGNAWQRIV